MALTAAAVVSNAVFLQKARHPEPWFMTRPASIEAPAEAPPLAVPSPRPRAEAPVQQVAPPPLAEVPVPVAAPAQAEARPLSNTALILELQQQLAEWGLYKGAVDGISGSRTRAAITAYEQARGLPVTGQPSAAVLDHIRTASISPAETPPAPKPVAAAPAPAPAVEPAPTVPELAPLAPQSVKAVTPQPLEEAAPLAAADPLASEIEIARRNRYLAVQQALNRIGYGPVPENGLAGADIDNAIRRFELDNGLPITGTPEDKLIERLVSIGAMEAT